MKFTIDQELCSRIPGFMAGVIHYKGIQVGDSPQMLKGRLRLFQESLFFDLEDCPVHDYPEIRAWRSLFKQLGKDPNRYRPSPEALFRRIAKQDFLPSIQSALDINTFFSLQYRIPMGIYDAARLNGPLTFRVGGEGAEYEGLNHRLNSLAHMIVACDQAGPFGSPFVDSLRTAVTEQTDEALQIAYLVPGTSQQSAEKLLHSVSAMFTQVNGGEGEVHLVTCR